MIALDKGGLLMQKIRTTVKVAGKEYTIASYDTQAHVQRVAAYVDRKMSELSLATRLPQAQLSVLAAVNIADDMLKAHDEINRLRKQLEEARAALEAKK
jgi:cell division protein ZapA